MSCSFIVSYSFSLAYSIDNNKRCQVVIDVNNLKNGKKPVKLQKGSPAGCVGEGKQSKGN